ncbi:MAG TPA: hypothetical protein EYP49_16220 [Anaerolineae bacterium]|nr:hypothetical protein [Anaerolineae bacterium]
MRKIPAILLGILLGSYMFLETDTILAHADRALADLARYPGVPRIVLQVRGKVHAYRYYRATRGATAQKSVSTIGMLKFAQEETPTPTPWCPTCPTPQPAATPGTGTPTPTPIIQATTIITDDFESGFDGPVTQDIDPDWGCYIIYGQPTFDGEWNTRRSGDWAQKVAGHASFRAGLYRHVPVAQGTTYDVHVFAHLYQYGGGMARLGVDPAGGTNPDAAVWSQMADLGTWIELTNGGTATSNYITIFLEGQSLLDDNTNAYFDDLTVQISGGEAIAAQPSIPTTGGVK